MLTNGWEIMEAFTGIKPDEIGVETKEQAAAEYVKEMVAALKQEEAADDAIDEWLAKHGS